MHFKLNYFVLLIFDWVVFMVFLLAGRYLSKFCKIYFALIFSIFNRFDID